MQPILACAIESSQNASLLVELQDSFCLEQFKHPRRDREDDSSQSCLVGSRLDVYNLSCRYQYSSFCIWCRAS